ncbi:MAG: transcription antitermination factor NusB [Ilumatobacteraceae bacterium]
MTSPLSDEVMQPAMAEDDDWNRDFDPRSDARERALNVLFEADLRSCSTADVTARIQVPLDDLTTVLIDGVSAHREQIDQLISTHSHSWTIDRMATTDRNVMRIATFELLGRPEIPTAVVLNEAVGLAKRYGTDDSGKFVNGMLSAIARTVRAGAGGVAGDQISAAGGNAGTASAD